MKAAIRMLASASLFLAFSGGAAADAVTDWNAKAVAAGYTADLSPDTHSRVLAIAHIAMFEGLNSIEPRYTPYRARLPAAAGASPDATVAAAAHLALVSLFPAQGKDFDAMYQTSLAGIADGAPKAIGIALGEQAASVILAERSKDGWDAPVTYRPFTVAGQYVPTVLPRSSTWGAVRPFALKTADQFRPPAPYALTSTQWAADYNEVRVLGAKTGSARTAEQNDIARFWQMNGAAAYNPVARQLSAAKGLDMLDNARLFALSSIATADAGVAMFEAKYFYHFWRPVTAIRNGGMSGSDATKIDATWEPFLTTPMHPEYPCAHCSFQGTAAAVLQALYGDVVPRFTLTSTTAPGVNRSFDRLSDYVADVINGRIYEGVHYRASGEAGAAMGRKIGDYVVQNFLKPLN